MPVPVRAGAHPVWHLQLLPSWLRRPLTPLPGKARAAPPVTIWCLKNWGKHSPEDKSFPETRGEKPSPSPRCGNYQQRTGNTEQLQQISRTIMNTFIWRTKRNQWIHILQPVASSSKGSHLETSVPILEGHQYRTAAIPDGMSQTTRD